MALCAGCSQFQRNEAASYRDATDAVARGDYRTANTILTKATDAQSTDPKLLMLAGKVALEQGNDQRASLIFEQLLRSQHAEAARSLLARAQLALGKPGDALTTLGARTLDDPVSAAVAVSALSQTGEFAKAMAVLDQGLVKFPQSVDMLILDGIRKQATGQPAQADAVASRVVKLEPDNVDALVFAGQLALREQRIADAGALFAHANQVRPDYRTPMLALATIARINADPAAEKRWIAKAMKVGAGDPAVAVYAAQLALEARHPDDAARILAPYQTATNQSVAQNPAIMLVMGLTYAQTGQTETAIADLSHFISHGGEDGRARFTLAVLLARKGDRVQAWKILKPLADAANAGLAPLRLAATLSVANNDPNRASYSARADALAHGDPDAADMAAASAAINAGQWQKADALYTRLLANPRTNQVVLLNNAAFTKISLGDLTSATALARRALALAPNDPVVMDTLGWALYNAQHASPEAASLLQRASDLQPGNQAIRQHALAARRAQP